MNSAAAAAAAEPGPEPGASSADRISREPAAKAATLASSRLFQAMKSSISGWSRSRHTILAARRVVPPDLMAPAALSKTLRKDMRPEEIPPPCKDSPAARMELKLVPEPEPYLKIRPSLARRSYRPFSPSKSSSTAWMKQAWGWGRE